MNEPANQWQVVETVDLSKKLKEAREILKVLADNTFDTINIPMARLIETHEHLVDARKSIDAAATALTRSR